MWREKYEDRAAWTENYEEIELCGERAMWRDNCEENDAGGIVERDIR